MTFYPALQTYITKLIREFPLIPAERRLVLENLSLYLREKTQALHESHLIFICTHNSRRSHLSQVWAAVAARYYDQSNIYTYSGGTEVTAFNPRAIAALERAGFQINRPGGKNPRYQVMMSDEADPLVCFSKKFSHRVNPRHRFMAIMTCSEADQNCPWVPGAEARLALPYTDPKDADGWPDESKVYDERCRQIAREMFYAVHLIKQD